MARINSSQSSVFSFQLARGWAGAALLSVTLLGTASSASAAVYYVDSFNGSDANTGLSPSAAWQTLGHVRHSRLYAGDYVLLVRGGVWYEQLTVSASGSDGAPITFGAYGPATALPVIDGSTMNVPQQSALVGVLFFFEQ
jgi:hypothetical protein